MSNNPYYSAAATSCPADCPGRRSPWQAANSDDFPCPLGVPFCGAWNAEEIFFKTERNPEEEFVAAQEAGKDEAAA